MLETKNPASSLEKLNETSNLNQDSLITCNLQDYKLKPSQMGQSSKNRINSTTKNYFIRMQTMDALGHYMSGFHGQKSHDYITFFWAVALLAHVPEEGFEKNRGLNIRTAKKVVQHLKYYIYFVFPYPKFYTKHLHQYKFNKTYQS